MKIFVVRPSADDPPPAGVRIRYLRLQQALEAIGHSIEICSQTAYGAGEQINADMLIFSKCDDCRSIILAAQAHAQGILCGVDLFDDYFSQSQDSRLVRRQAWLDAVSPFVDFMLCSTPRMAAIVASTLGNMPVHVLNDPLEALHADELRETIARKCEEARASNIIDVAWFGVGVNALFPIGLHDVVAFVDSLRSLERRGHTVRLTILTNSKALDGPNLAMLRRLGIPFQIAVWSETLEKQVLERSLLAFLPVNGQPFSIAKSLNRAVTALVSGTQLLVAGYPLYARLDPFLYRSPDEFLDGMQAAEFKLRAETMGDFLELMTDLADPGCEAAHFGSFIADLPPVSSRPLATALLLLHGWLSGQGIDRFARSHAVLTVASPFTPHTIKANARFERSGFRGHFDLTMDATTYAAMAPRWQAQCRQVEWGADSKFRTAVPHGLDELLEFGWSPQKRASEAEVLALYAPVMDHLVHCLADLFPDRSLIISENAAPFSFSSEKALARAS